MVMYFSRPHSMANLPFCNAFCFNKNTSAETFRGSIFTIWRLHLYKPMKITFFPLFFLWCGRNSIRKKNNRSRNRSFRAFCTRSYTRSQTRQVLPPRLRPLCSRSFPPPSTDSAYLAPFNVPSFQKRGHVPRFFLFLQFIAKPLAFIPRSSHFSEKPTFYSETVPFPFFLHTIAPRFRRMTYPINPAASAATINTVHHQVRIKYTAVAVR